MGYMTITLESFWIGNSHEPFNIDVFGHQVDPSLIDPEQFMLKASSNKRNNAPTPATPTHHSLAEDPDLYR